MNFRRLFSIGVLLSMPLLTVPALVQAQTYPTRPVRLIVPASAGGPNDAVGRPVAEGLSTALAQPVVMDFRSGASGNIGAALVAKAAPDGYTLLLIATAFTLSPSVTRDLPFDPISDFSPISSLAKGDIVLVTHGGLHVHTVADLVALAKQRNGKLTFGSSGIGTSLHLAGEMLKQASGTDLLHVSYKGAAPAMADLLGGHVDFMFIALPPALASIKSGRLRAVAVASVSRTQSLPDVPTMIEAGYKDFTVDSRYGMLAPAKTPSAVINRLNAEVIKVLGMPETKARYAKMGLQPAPNAPTEYGEYLKSEIAKWAAVVKAAGFRPGT